MYSHYSYAKVSRTRFVTSKKARKSFMSEQLEKKPLVEALLEVKWGLEGPPDGPQKDPVYPLFVGQLYALVKDSYSHVEKLPATSVPDEITPYIVKYRFRETENGWPLVQAGPGIASLNFTDSYKWDKFLPLLLPVSRKRLPLAALCYAISMQ